MDESSFQNNIQKISHEIDFFSLNSGVIFCTGTRENCLHFTHDKSTSYFITPRNKTKNMLKKYKRPWKQKKRLGLYFSPEKQKEEEGWSFCKNIQLAFSHEFLGRKKNCSLSIEGRWCGPERAFLKKERLENSLPSVDQQQRSKM